MLRRFSFRIAGRRVAPAGLMAAVLLVASWEGVALAQAPAPAQPAARDKERADLRAAMESFAKAFEAADAKALADYWTAEGEYRGEAGEPIRGRAALQAAFAKFFAKNPKVKASTKSESIRFLSKDSAIEEGTVTVRRDPGQPETKAHYSALFVREEGRWRMAQLTEETTDEASLDDLAWLVGEWASKEQDTEIRTTYAWEDANKKFLRVRFSIKEKDGRTLGGSQMIGIDPASGQLHSWTFEAAGGIGQGDWLRDGDHWTVEAAGTMTDGRILTCTNVLRRINDDLFTWQSVNRRLDDEEIPDLAPVKVSRIKAK